MEQNPKKEVNRIYQVLWHPEIKEDFEELHPSITQKIIEAAQYKLSNAPLLIGEPLKGTTNRLWKIYYSKYRIIYTLNENAREVWVLSAQKREIIYRKQHLLNLLTLAIAIEKTYNPREEE